MILSTHGIVNSGSSNPLNTNLVSVYKAESNANDSLGTYNGTAQGGLTYTTGKTGNAFTGNFINAYVGLPNNSFNFTNDFSISMWINLTTVDIASTQELFSNADYNGSGDFGYRLTYMGATRFLRFTIYGASTVNLATASSSINGDVWNNIVVTRKLGSRSRIYINGALSTSNSSTVNPTYTGTFAPAIGAYKTTTVPYLTTFLTFNSKIDETNIWNKELTATEVTELYNSATGKFYPY